MALGKVRDRQAVTPLVGMLKHEDSNIRYKAAAALGEIGDSQAVPILEWLVQHDLGEDFTGQKVKEIAAEAIDKIKRRQY